jgi:hypothetical protein
MTYEELECYCPNSKECAKNLNREFIPKPVIFGYPEPNYRCNYRPERCVVIDNLTHLLDIEKKLNGISKKLKVKV